MSFNADDDSGVDPSNPYPSPTNKAPTAATTPYVPGNSAFDSVSNFYQKYLGRTPENNDVVSSWLSGDQGDLSAIEKGISTSPEAVAYAKAQTNKPPTTPGSGGGGGGSQFGWVDTALSQAQSTDDPNYWYGVISKDPKAMAGDPSAIAYWQGRIAQGDGALGVRNGTIAKFNDGGNRGTGGPPSVAPPTTPLSGSSLMYSGTDPAIAANQTALYNTLMGRASQSLAVSPSDLIIAGQTKAYKDTQTEGERQYMEALAEKSGPYANLDSQTRSNAETANQNTSGFQASLIQSELTARRTEIQNALTEMGSMLTSQQQLALQQQLGLINASLGQGQLGLSATQDANYWDALRSGLITA